MVQIPMVLPQLLAWRAQETPDHVYLEDVYGARRTFLDAHLDALKWAALWRAFRVGVGNTVLVMMPTGLTAVSAWLGLSWLRAIEVPVNTSYKGRMLGYVIANSGARFMLVDGRYMDQLVALDRDDGLGVLEHIVVVGVSEIPSLSVHVTTLDSLSGDMPVEASESYSGPEPHDIATVLYTSGTTGPSKGVLVPWGQLHATATGSIPLEELGPADAYYSPFPLFHVSGKNPLYQMALVGGRVVLRERFSTEHFWADIEAHRCTTTLLMGAMANFIYRQAPRPDDANSPLVNLFMVPLIPDVEDFKVRFGVRVCTVFNMTETSCPIVSDGFQLANARSCGRVRAGYEVRLVDEWDRTVPSGEMGELVVRSQEPHTLMAGYLGMPEATVQSWRNQWLHTGDGFTQDDEGNFYFVDRLKDAIRRRGENISSAEVEADVNSHPMVAESAAVAVPSEWGEDEVKVYVVIKTAERLAPADLILYLENRMPRFMVPRYLEFVAELPKTPTDKVRKAELRAAGITEATWDALNRANA